MKLCTRPIILPLLGPVQIPHIHWKPRTNYDEEARKTKEDTNPVGAFIDVMAARDPQELDRLRTEAWTGGLTIDQAVEALEKARELPQFQRITAYQQILNNYRSKPAE